MSESLSQQAEIAYIAGIIEHQLREGFLFDIASAKISHTPENFSPSEVAQVILPEPVKGQSLEPRWTLVDKAESEALTTDLIAANSEVIMSLVEGLNLRRTLNGERQAEDIDRIDSEKAIFVVEGGANKTSVVRRAVAVQAMRQVYGNDLSSRALYQIGADLAIKPTRELTKVDGSKESVTNAEYKTIRDLAGDFLPATEPFTQFEANLATALAEGYDISELSDDIGLNYEAITRVVVMKHTDSRLPRLVLIQPSAKGLKGGFEALRNLATGRQFVTASNGQYPNADLKCNTD